MPKLAALEVFGVLPEVADTADHGGGRACKPACRTKCRTCRAGCCPDEGGVPLVAPHVLPARVVMLGWAWRKVDADTADHGGGREGRSDAASASGHLESAKDSGWC